jgi:hypothetical protein
VSAPADVIGVSYRQILGVSIRSQYHDEFINAAIFCQWTITRKSNLIRYRALPFKTSSSSSRLSPVLKRKCRGLRVDHQNQ